MLGVRQNAIHGELKVRLDPTNTIDSMKCSKLYAVAILTTWPPGPGRGATAESGR
jgi:hypothetical protein